MGYNDIGNDWQACGIASGSLGGLIAGSFGFWEFRSQDANCRASFIFAAAGFGVGLSGSLGGGSMPSPSDVAHNRQPDLWSDLNCERKFSVRDLDLSWGQMSNLAASACVGYQSTSIAAGKYPVLFSASDASGWSTGVGLNASALWGWWKMLSHGPYY
jgi:hypothetical protein